MDILILALATWRISRLLANEDGPFNIFEGLRLKAGAYYDEYGQRLGGNTLSTGMLCVWCSSVWIGAFWLALYRLTGEMWPAVPFALSAIAILVDELIEHLQNDDDNIITVMSPDSQDWEMTQTEGITHGKG